jgi:hypothetical protein
VLRPAAAVELSGSPKPPTRRAGAAPPTPAPARRWPWVTAALVIALAIGGAAAWRFLPLAPHKPEVDAELAKARAEAEDAQRRALAAAADAEKAKRQLEAERAADAKAKAEAKPEPRPEPRAAKPRPAVEPSRPTVEPPRQAAAPPAAVARKDPEPAPATQAPSAITGNFRLWGSAQPVAEASYDGAWTATRTCEAYEELPSQTESWSLNVSGGEFVVATGTPGQPGYSQARGRPSAAGALVLLGDGIAISKRFIGKSQLVTFNGRADGGRFLLKGALGDRNCTLVLARR